MPPLPRFLLIFFSVLNYLLNPSQADTPLSQTTQKGKNIHLLKKQWEGTQGILLHRARNGCPSSLGSPEDSVLGVSFLQDLNLKEKISIRGSTIGNACPLLLLLHVLSYVVYVLHAVLYGSHWLQLC